MVSKHCTGKVLKNIDIFSVSTISVPFKYFEIQVCLLWGNIQCGRH